MAQSIPPTAPSARPDKHRLQTETAAQSGDEHQSDHSTEYWYSDSETDSEIRDIISGWRIFLTTVSIRLLNDRKHILYVMEGMFMSC